MKVIILDNILVEGKHTERDTVADLPEDTAKQLIGYGRAVEANKQNLADLAERQKVAAAAAAPKGEGQ